MATVLVLAGIVLVIYLVTKGLSNVGQNLADGAQLNKHIPILIINVVMAFVSFFWMWGHVESIRPDSPFLAKFIASLVAAVIGLSIGIVILVFLLFWWLMGWSF
jgi:hypothetical protein